MGYTEPEKKEEPQRLPAIVARAMQYEKIIQRWNLEQVTDVKDGWALVRLNDKVSPGAQCDMAIKTLITQEGSLRYLRVGEAEVWIRARDERIAAMNESLSPAEGLKRVPNIAAPLEILFNEWEENGAFGCDMLLRYEAMTSLQQMLDAGKTFTEDEIVKIGQDIAKGLSAFHEKGLLHGNVSTETVCMNRYGACKLLGFDASENRNTLRSFHAPKIISGFAPAVMYTASALFCARWTITGNTL